MIKFVIKDIAKTLLHHQKVAEIIMNAQKDIFATEIFVLINVSLLFADEVIHVSKGNAYLLVLLVNPMRVVLMEIALKMPAHQIHNVSHMNFVVMDNVWIIVQKFFVHQDVEKDNAYLLKNVSQTISVDLSNFVWVENVLIIVHL